MTARGWSDLYVQTQQDRLGRADNVVQVLSDFVRAYDVCARFEDRMFDSPEWLDAVTNLDRQYELLDSLGEDRP